MSVTQYVASKSAPCWASKLYCRKVKAEATFSLTGKSYLYYDLGIVKCHFEIGAGKENYLERIMGN